MVILHFLAELLELEFPVYSTWLFSISVKQKKCRRKLDSHLWFFANFPTKKEKKLIHTRTKNDHSVTGAILSANLAF